MPDRSFGYDAPGRLENAANPDSGATKYAYNDTGTPRSKTDARQLSVFYEYDDLDRVAKKTAATLVSMSARGGSRVPD